MMIVPVPQEQLIIRMEKVIMEHLLVFHTVSKHLVTRNACSRMINWK